MGYSQYAWGQIKIKYDRLAEATKKFDAEKSKNDDLSGCSISNGYFEVDGDFGTVAEKYLVTISDFIAPYVEEGEIRVDGQDSDDIWRVIFDGKGKYLVQEAVLI